MAVAYGVTGMWPGVRGRGRIRPVDDLQRLRRAAAKSRASDTQADRDRAARNALIYDVITSRSQTQADVCRAVGLTREQVRRIVEAETKRRADPPAPQP